jgi:hypothetical protein
MNRTLADGQPCMAPDHHASPTRRSQNRLPTTSSPSPAPSSRTPSAREDQPTGSSRQPPFRISVRGPRGSICATSTLRQLIRAATGSLPAPCGRHSAGAQRRAGRLRAPCIGHAAPPLMSDATRAGGRCARWDGSRGCAHSPGGTPAPCGGSRPLVLRGGSRPLCRAATRASLGRAATRARCAVRRLAPCATGVDRAASNGSALRLGLGVRPPVGGCVRRGGAPSRGCRRLPSSTTAGAGAGP